MIGTCQCSNFKDTYQISNLDSDQGGDDLEPAPRSGTQMRNVKKECGPAQTDNNAIIKDIIHAFADAMTAQAGAHQVPVYLPTQTMAGQDLQLQQAVYAISQSGNQLPPQVRAVVPESMGGPSTAAMSVQPTASAGVVTTHADVNGSYVNKAYQTE